VYAEFGDFENPGNPNSLAKFVFYEKLSKLPGVTGIAASLNAPGSNANNTSHEIRLPSGQSVQVSRQFVTNNFFEIYNLQARAGRLFDSHIDLSDNKTNVVLNWAAAQALGFTSPNAAVGQSVSGITPGKSTTLTIIGIAPDILQRSMREKNQPTIYFRFDRSPGSTPWLTVRTNGDVAGVEKEIADIWRKSFPTKDLNMHSVQEEIAQTYAEDVRYAKLLGASSSLAIAIAAFGIYVLSAYSVQRRAREIVLRKLYGAGGREIAQILGREFGSLIAVSALIGLPVAYLASSRYLAEFVERAPMGAWPLLMALMLALIVAMSATCRHVLIAMKMKPALALNN
jgi:putative ABC transport system permease protein